ncbi:MAG TPA: hypothetical protein VF637_10250, partial [Sphingomicrobium sp.]|jgi:hypothetical protein
MPRYFFSTANGHCVQDEEGDILPDDEAARSLAVDILSEILPSQRDQLRQGGQYSIFVAAEDRTAIYEITATARRIGN